MKTKTATSLAGSATALRRREAGYTLLELLVVITVAGLLTAVFMPNIFTGKDTVELRAAAKNLTTTLKRSRGEALAENRETVVFIDVDAKNYSRDGDGRTYLLPADAEIHLLTAAEEIVGDRRGAIRFFPDGSATGGGLRLSRNGQVYQVSVHWLTGQVSLVR